LDFIARPRIIGGIFASKYGVGIKEEKKESWGKTIIDPMCYTYSFKFSNEDFFTFPFWLSHKSQEEINYWNYDGNAFFMEHHGRKKMWYFLIEIHH
jgi:hypothetical protein